MNVYPGIPLVVLYHTSALIYNKKNEEALQIIEELAKNDPDNPIAHLCRLFEYSLQGRKEHIFEVLSPDLERTCLRDPTYSHLLSVIFALQNEKNEALRWVENAVNVGFLNYPLLNEKDPLLENIRGEERFKKLMDRVKYEWENFEV